MDFSPTDRDMMIRTIYGEAGNQPDLGKAAVAHVIMNRFNDGGYGKSPTQVVLQPNAFEPWSREPHKLATFSPKSQEYQAIGQIVDDVMSGKAKDPTDGALNFFAPDTQKALGRPVPDWAKGDGKRIGDHAFFNPKASNDIPDYLSEFASAKQNPSIKSASAPSKTDEEDLLSSFLKAKESEPQIAQAAPQAQNNVPVAPPFYAVDVNGQEVVAPRPVANVDYKPSAIPQPVQDYGNRMQELFGQNAGTIAEGIKDVANSNTATGVGKTALGALGYLTAPFNAIDKPIENATGNKEFGERAALLVPGSGIGKLANMARPTVGALTDIVKDIGRENLPNVIRRLESNPNLTLLDVAPAIRGNAAGLATDPRNIAAMNHLNDFRKERIANKQNSTIEAFEDVLGKTPNVKTTVDEIKKASEKVGKEMIEPSLASAKPVNVSGVVADIDKQIAPDVLADLIKNKGSTDKAISDVDKRWWNLRQRLGGGDKPIDPQTAHELQMELRRTSADPQMGYQGRVARRKLVDAIDEASDKTYKPALKEYADSKSVDEAFKHGFDIFSNPTGAEKSLSNHPDMWKAWADDASKSELDAVKKGILLGARSRISNMRKGIDIPKDSFTHERIAAVVGEKEADKIIQTLNDWRDISATHNEISGGSATAVRQAGQKNREVRENKSGGDLLSKMVPATVIGAAAHMTAGQPWGALAALGAVGAGKGANIAGRAHDVASNTAYAKWAASSGAKREKLLDILRQASADANPVSNSEKLLNLAPSSILQALPR